MNLIRQKKSSKECENYVSSRRIRISKSMEEANRRVAEYFDNPEVIKQIMELIEKSPQENQR